MSQSRCGVGIDSLGDWERKRKKMHRLQYRTLLGNTWNVGLPPAFLVLEQNLNVCAMLLQKDPTTALKANCLILAA